MEKLVGKSAFDLVSGRTCTLTDVIEDVGTYFYKVRYVDGLEDVLNHDEIVIYVTDTDLKK